jgi:hypothetical protein
MHASQQRPPEQEPSYLASTIVTFFPLVLLAILFVFFLRFARRGRERMEQGLELSRQMVAELRAIREALTNPRKDAD